MFSHHLIVLTFITGVHYLMFPAPKPEFANPDIEEAVAHMQGVIELGRAARDRRKLPLKVRSYTFSWLMITCHSTLWVK